MPMSLTTRSPHQRRSRKEVEAGFGISEGHRAFGPDGRAGRPSHPSFNPRWQIHRQHRFVRLIDGLDAFAVNPSGHSLEADAEDGVYDQVGRGHRPQQGLPVVRPPGQAGLLQAIQVGPGIRVQRLRIV